MLTRHIHVAIIDTDIPVPTVYEARGLYSSLNRVSLESAAIRLNLSLVKTRTADSSLSHKIRIHTSTYDVVGGSYPPVSMLRKSTSPPTYYTEDDEEDEDEGAFRSIDAILITGSTTSVNSQGEQFQWIAKLQDFIRRVWADYPEVKMYGACFGHHIIAKALFAQNKDHQHHADSPLVEVEECPEGYEIGIYPITLNPEFVASTLGEKFAKGLKSDDGKWRIQLFHGDRVIGVHPSTTFTLETSASTLPSLPAPWLVIGSTGMCPIQGFYHPGRVLTYQGHFEFDAFVNTETILDGASRGAGWKAQLKDHLLHINEPGDDDSGLAAEIVVRFFVGDDLDLSVSQGVQAIRDNQQPGLKIECSSKEEGAARSVMNNGLPTPTDKMSVHV